MLRGLVRSQAHRALSSGPVRRTNLSGSGRQHSRVLLAKQHHSAAFARTQPLFAFQSATEHQNATMPIKSRAIVAREPEGGPNWKLEDVEVSSDPGPKQLLVRMVASGICHTDIVLSAVPPGTFGVQYPKIVGHEGAGIVEKVGPGVTSVQPGDPVLMSFDYCKECSYCRKDHPAYCDEFPLRNYLGGTGSITLASGGQEAHAKFFGQSSFANHSIVSESSILNAKDLIEKEEELKLFAPLGCGLQTGAGAIINVTKPDKDETVLVMGLGAVGLAAIMAARVAGCKTIIALDKTPSRLELAKSMGATHGLNSMVKDFKMSDAVRAISPDGANVVIETTGVPFIIEAGLQSTAKRGQFVQIGVPPPDFQMTMGAVDLINSGIAIRGNIEGDSEPSKFVPQMIKWYREGKFPIDKIVKEYPVDKFQDALGAMHEGSTIKPLLIF